MFQKKIMAAMAILTMCATSAQSAGFLGQQYLAVGYQHGEFGDDKNRELLDNTNGFVVTYNHPIIDRIDVGGTVGHHWADGKDRTTTSITDVDYTIGGPVTYVTFYSTSDDPLKFFISPQLGIQREKEEYKSGSWKKSETDTDIYLGVESGVEYQRGLFTLTQSVTVSHTKDTDINAKAHVGVDLTQRIALVVGGEYQLNDDNDYTLTTGLVVRF